MRGNLYWLTWLIFQSSIYPRWLRVQNEQFSEEKGFLVRDTDILTDRQHSFRRNRSCESQLILTTHDLATTLDKKGHITFINSRNFSTTF